MTPTDPDRSPSRSSSVDPSPRGPDPDDDRTRDAFDVVAERKLATRAARGEPAPAQPTRWLATVADRDRQRLAPRAAALAAQHPAWTLEQLADELDPDTAPHDDLHHGLVQAGRDAIKSHDQRAADAAPPPPDIRQQLATARSRRTAS
jgi:hypothetical protein